MVLFCGEPPADPTVRRLGVLLRSCGESGSGRDDAITPLPAPLADCVGTMGSMDMPAPRGDSAPRGVWDDSRGWQGPRNRRGRGGGHGVPGRAEKRQPEPTSVPMSWVAAGSAVGTPMEGSMESADKVDSVAVDTAALRAASAGVSAAAGAVSKDAVSKEAAGSVAAVV